MKKRINIAFFSLMGLMLVQMIWFIIDARAANYSGTLAYKYFLPVFTPTVLVFIVVSAIVEAWEEN